MNELPWTLFKPLSKISFLLICNRNSVYNISVLVWGKIAWASNWLKGKINMGVIITCYNLFIIYVYVDAAPIVTSSVGHLYSQLFTLRITMHTF